MGTCGSVVSLMSSEGSSSQPKLRGASLWSSGLPMSVYYCPSEGPAESLEPVASPGPNSGEPASGRPSVAGPLRRQWDRPISLYFRPSSAAFPMTEIPDYRPPSGPLTIFRRYPPIGFPLLISAETPTWVSGALISGSPRG